MTTTVSTENIFRSILGVVAVVQNKDTISLTGLNAERLFAAITKTWGTSRIPKNIYKREAFLTVSFKSFFLLDVIYMLETLLPKAQRFGLNYAKMEQAIECLQSDTWYGEGLHHPERKRKLNWSKLDKFVMKPLEDQMRFFKTYEENTFKYNLNGYLLAASAGTGKTLSNIFLGQLVDADVCIYVVPPNAVVDVWDKTLSQCFKKPEEYWTSRSVKPLHHGYKHYVFHYQQLARAVEFFSKWPNKTTKFYLGVDESHNFNDLRSDQTNNLIDLNRVTKTDDTVFSSGTAFKAMGYETIPLMRCTDPLFDPEVEEAYRKTFGQAQNQALEILARRIGRVSFTVEKKAIVTNTLTETTVKVNMPTAEEFTLDVISRKMALYVDQRKEYYYKEAPGMIRRYFEILSGYESRLKSDGDRKAFKTYQTYAAMIHKGYDPVQHKDESLYCNTYERKSIMPALSTSERLTFRDVKSVYKYVDLKILGEALGRVLGQERTRCNVEMAMASDRYTIEDPVTKEQHKTNLVDIIQGAQKKTIIFTSFVEVVSVFDKQLKKQGFNPLTVTAANSKDLPKVVKAFFDDPKMNPLVTTFKMLGTAVPLIAANTIVMANSPYRSNEREQTISRAYRLGQDAPVNVFDLYLDTGTAPNISTRSGDIMEWSKKQAEAIMGKSFDETALESINDSNVNFECITQMLSLEELFVF